MKILDSTRRRGFTAGEVLLSLLVIGVVISIFVGLNNFTGVKNEQTKARMASFERMVADVQVSLREETEITPAQACNADFLKNYYKSNISDAVDFPGYQINNQPVTAIKIPGYGVLAILPNAQDGYCETHWEDEVLNVSNPPVAFIAIDEDIASSAYNMAEISINVDGEFVRINSDNTSGDALFTQNNAIAFSANSGEQQIMSNDVPNDIPVYSCNASEFIWAIKEVFYDKLEQNNSCKEETPFHKKLEADYCCPEYSRLVYMGHYSTITNGCIPSFCPGTGFVNNNELNKYNECINGDNEACSNVEIKDTGMVNLYCKNGTQNDYVRCECPNDKKYWIAKGFLRQKTLLSYDGRPIDNGICIDDCSLFTNENGVPARFIADEDNMVCKCPFNMVFNNYPEGGSSEDANVGICTCKNKDLVYDEEGTKDCICPKKGTEKYDALIENILKENKKRRIKSVYDSTNISEGCKSNCKEEETTEDGEHCIPKPSCEGFTVGDNCICPAIEDISKSGNTWTNKNNKTITLEENEIYDASNPNECKSECQGYLKPNNERNGCICDETKVNANKKSYEYYNGQKDTNCIGTCDKEYKKPRKSGSNYTCECYDTPQEAINVVKADNSTLTGTALTNKLKDYQLDGFKENGIYKYDTEGKVVGKWNTAEANCMNTCPSAQECEAKGELVDYKGCGCLPLPPVCTKTPCPEQCKAGEIAIYNTDTLLAIGNHPQYPADGHYCVTDNIKIDTNITDDNSLPIAPDGFSGTIKGQGKTISNLEINPDNENIFSGLIPSIKKNKDNEYNVTDLTIEGKVTADDTNCSSNNTYAGILAGYNEGKIKNVNTTGTVKGCTVGGLVGGNDGEITASSSSGTITGNNAGGFAGDNTGTITNSSVVSGTTVNGLACAAGFAANNTKAITKSYVEGVTVLADTQAGGFVCTNDNTIDHSYVKGGSVSAGKSAGFAGINSGEIGSAYVEDTNIIASLENGAGFVNTNDNTIENAYVYGINISSDNATGFVNENSKTVENVYAIVNNITTKADNIVFAGNATDKNTINSYFGDGTGKANIVSCIAGADCSLNNEAIVRELDDFNSTPSTDMYNTWSADEWCFNCSSRAKLKGMPNNTVNESSCVMEDKCPLCPTTVCQGNQAAKGNNCECSCDEVDAQTAYEKLTDKQKPWYKNPATHSSAGYMCLACGSTTQGNYTINYELITQGDNAGYCGCPPSNELPTGYLKGYEYVQGNANDNKDALSCRGNKIECGACPSGYALNPANCDCVAIPKKGEKYLCPETGSILIPGNDEAAKTYYRNNVLLADGENKNNVVVPTNSEEILSKIGNDTKYPASGQYCLLGNIKVTPSEKDKAHIAPEFNGGFYGADYTISDINITDTTKENVGFFDNITGGKIQDLTITGNVTAKNTDCKTQYAGILAGRNVGFINNVSVSGSVTGCNVGGLIGNNGGQIKNSTVKEATVTGDNAGGFVGNLGGALQEGCSVQDGTTVKGTTCAGGFVWLNKIDLTKAYVNNISVESVNKAGGFACINNNEITYSYVNGGEVTGKLSAGFVAENKGTVSSAYVDGTEIGVKDSSDNTQKAAGFVNTNKKDATVKNVYVNEIKFNGGSASGFASNNSGTVANVYVILSNNIVSSSINGFMPDSDKDNIPSNVYWGIKEGFTGNIYSCNDADSENCKEINKRKIAQFSATPNEYMYNTWNGEDNKNIWCFSCSSRAILKGMPSGAPKAEGCADNGCPLSCEKLKAPDDTTFEVLLYMNNEGECVCPENCSAIDDIVVSLTYDYPFECNPDMRGKAQDKNNDKYCLQYKCDFVNKLDNFEQPQIRLVSKPDSSDGNKFKCQCPDANAFENYLKEHQELMYDGNWNKDKDDLNLSCLTYKCDEAEAFSTDYNMPDVRLAYNEQTGTCECPDEAAFADYLAKNPKLEYDNEWAKDSAFPNLSCVKEKSEPIALCGSQYDNCHQEGNIYRCNKIVDGNIANDDRCSKGYIPICSMAELQKIGVAANYKMDECYLVMNDISAENQIKQIGNEDFNVVFTGVFDGDNHKISKLSLISDKEKQNVGLFVKVQDAKILNLELLYSDILLGKENVGGLAGQAINSIIQNCKVKADIEGINNIGGLIGITYDNIKILNSSANANIKGERYIGGLVGVSNGDINLKASFAEVNIEGIYYIGGLVGLSKNGITIEDSAVKGTLNGSMDFVGGLVGVNYNNPINVSDSSADVNIVANDHSGCLIGETFSGGKISNVTSSGNLEGNNNLGGLIGYSQGELTIEKSNSSCNITGDNNLGGLVGNIDKGTITDSFATGTIKGDSIIGGLIGGINEGEITKSNAKGNVTGSSYIGGLIGYVVDDTVTDSCYASGIVTAVSDNAGGLIGYLKKGTVKNSYANNTVLGSNFIGGLVGLSEGSIEKSFATGNIKGTNDIGGLAGGLKAGTIKNSYSLASVTGDSYTGGAVGYIEGGTVSNSYTNGSVSAESSFGGFVGVSSSGEITDCYAKPNYSSASNNKLPSFIGFDYDSTIKNCYAVYTNSGDSTYSFIETNVESTIKNCYSQTYTNAPEGTDNLKYLPLEEMYSSRTDDIYKDWDDNTVWCMSCSATPTLRNMPEGAEQNATCAAEGGCNTQPEQEPEVESKNECPIIVEDEYIKVNDITYRKIEGNLYLSEKEFIKKAKKVTMVIKDNECAAIGGRLPDQDEFEKLREKLGDDYFFPNQRYVAIKTPIAAGGKANAYRKPWADKETILFTSTPGTMTQYHYWCVTTKDSSNLKDVMKTVFMDLNNNEEYIYDQSAASAEPKCANRCPVIEGTTVQTVRGEDITKCICPNNLISVYNTKDGDGQFVKLDDNLYLYNQKFTATEQSYSNIVHNNECINMGGRIPTKDEMEKLKILSVNPHFNYLFNENGIYIVNEKENYQKEDIPRAAVETSSYAYTCNLTNYRYNCGYYYARSTQLSNANYYCVVSSDNINISSIQDCTCPTKEEVKNLEKEYYYNANEYGCLALCPVYGGMQSLRDENDVTQCVCPNEQPNTFKYKDVSYYYDTDNRENGCQSQCSKTEKGNVQLVRDINNPTECICPKEITYTNNTYYYDENNLKSGCQTQCSKTKNDIQMVRDTRNVNQCVCPSGKQLIYKDKYNNEFIYIDDGVYMYNQKSEVLTKEEAINYCASVGSTLPTSNQLSKARKRVGNNSIGTSWRSYSLQKDGTKLPAWCFANSDKIKELKADNMFYCYDGCQIKCRGDKLNEKECYCGDKLECPINNYDALYVIRYKMYSDVATLYDQFMGKSTSADGARTVSEHFKQIANVLSEEDKNRKFDKFHAYIVGVIKDENDVIKDAEVAAAISPRVWYYKFAAELAEEDSVPLSDLVGSTDYSLINPYVLNIKCKYELDGEKVTASAYDECAANSGKITEVTCKSQSQVSPYIKGYNYDNSVSTCRGEKSSSGTFDKIGNGISQKITSSGRNSDCEQLCKEDNLENNEECLDSCENVVMTENIFESCGGDSNGSYSSYKEFCTGGSIQLYPLCNKIRVDETFRRYNSPLILDLLGDGYKFTSVENGVRFDLDADGIIEQVAWTDFQKEFDDAFLWYDKNNDGKILNGKELFGDQNGAENGYYELAKYDGNKDNVINKDDAIYEKLKLWVDFNKNAQVDKGETKTLAEAGVIEIPLEFNIVRDKDGNIMTDEHGNITGFVGKFKQLVETIVNGIKTLIEKIGTMIDVFFASN